MAGQFIRENHNLMNLRQWKRQLKTLIVLACAVTVIMLLVTSPKLLKVGWPSPKVGAENENSVLRLCDILTEKRSLHMRVSDKSKPATCTFPEVDPFDESIMKYVKRYETLDCSRGIPSIVDVAGDELKVDPVKVKDKLGSTRVDECRYRRLSRSQDNDFKVIYHPWSQSFKSSIRLQADDEQIQVDCYSEDGVKATLVARSYIGLVRRRKEREKKRLDDYRKHTEKHSPKERLNILLAGLDGTSKQNFIRSMPKTRNFLLSNMKAIELNMFNKVGYNTFPNIVPLLTGLHANEIPDFNSNKEPFDKVDHLFAWHHFQKAGYRTALHVDDSLVTEFHYNRHGWANPSFDFYPRPVVLASELDRDIFKRAGWNCMGDTPEVSWAHDFLVQLAATYREAPSSPYFAYTFLSRLTHDDLNMASTADEPFLGFLTKLVDGKLLNNTLLVFFSDHGERFGPLRGTYNGVVESNLPIMFLVFPPWFQTKYPEVMRNMRTNTKRLATHFDVHATLMDLLTFTGKPKEHQPGDRAISLFTQIPSNRTCDSAGIPFRYCSCKNLANVKSNTNVSAILENHLVNAFIKKVRSYTDDHRDICMPISHSKTVGVWEINPTIHPQHNDVFHYFMVIQTNPKSNLYEGLASITCNDNRVITAIYDVTRINLYNDETDCTKDSTFKEFCFCYNQNSTSLLEKDNVWSFNIVEKEYLNENSRILGHT